MDPQIIQPNQNSTNQTVTAQPGLDQQVVQPPVVQAVTQTVPVAVAASPAPAPSVPVPPVASTRDMFAPDPQLFGGSQAAAQQPKPRKGLKLVLAGVSALVVIGLVFGGGYTVYANTSKSNATKQGQAFIANLNKGDTKAAYALTSADLQKNQTEAQFKEALGDLSASKPTFDKQTTSVDGKTATYVAFESGLPEDANGSTQGTFTIQLVKSGMTDWKVDTIDVQ